MKKILAIALALVMVLGLASSALAVSWAAPAASSSASPFAIEVVKLGVNADVTGAKYYTVLSDAAAYNYSNIYFAIKLSVPSYANANSYYGNSGFLSGSKVKVTINYTNVSDKSSETYYVQLTDAAQTLWYNGSGFDASWTTSASTNCGCGDKHILKAVAVGNKEISIKACVGASGELKDIKIDGCYKVEEKKYYGVIPCVNCSPVDLKGFLFSGDCAAYKVFFSTNAANKVTGAYIVDSCGDKKNMTVGTAKDFDKALYGWAPDGIVENCATGSCGVVKYTRTQLPKGAMIDATTWSTWVNSFKYNDKSHADMVTDFGYWTAINANTKYANKFDTLYYKDDDGNFQEASWAAIAPSDYKAITAMPTTTLNGLTVVDMNSDPTIGTAGAAATFFSGDSFSDNSSVISGAASTANGTKVVYKYYVDLYNTKDVTMGYQYSTDYVEYLKTKYIIAGAGDDMLYKQTSATSINCDTNEASYLNALNHMYALLGFTYADVAAGNVYMSKDILLANFGFSTSVCDTKTWGAYTAAITVATVAEVPATGSVTYVGFAMIVLAIAAAVVTKKVRA